MKKLYTKLALAVSMIFAGLGSANAQETLTVLPVTVAPGEEAEVVVNYMSEVERSGFNMEVILPEGLSYVSTYNEAKDEDEYFVLGSSATAAHQKSEDLVDEAQKHAKMMVFHLKEKALKDGVLLSFKVKAAEDFEGGKIEFKGIKFNGGQYLEDFTVDVEKGTPTAISNVETNVEKAASFNLGGVKFGKSGIRVQKGKKFVQK